MLTKITEPEAMGITVNSRRRIIGIFASIVLACSAGMYTPAYAIDPGIPGNIFELDRNAVDDTGNTKDDWSNVLYKGPNTVNGNIVATTLCTANGLCDSNYPGVLPDPPGFTLFVGGSKDILDITGWSCRDQKAPDKDELTNAYAVAYNVAGELVVFLGADRFDNAGTATMGFWLLQSSLPNPSCLPAGDGKFRDALGNPAVHATGDLLIVADFTNGGAIGTIRVFKWVGSGGTDGSLDKLYDSNGSPNVDCFNAPSGDICGTINQNTTTSPWNYIPKGASTDSDFIKFGFMEIGVNLSRLFAGSVPCFSTFVAESRSSAEPSASQKDFVMGSFNVCGISVSKICTNNQPNFSGTPPTIKFTYDVGGCIANTGFGSVTDFGLTDSPDALANLTFYRPKAGYEPTATVCDSYLDIDPVGGLSLKNIALNHSDVITSTASIAPDERIIWLANFTSTVNGQHDTVTATAKVSSGGPVLTPKTDSADCPAKQFSPSIDVTKNCSVFLADTGSQLVVKNKISGTVCNTGDVPLTNVTVVDSTSVGDPPVHVLPGDDIPDPILGPITLPVKTGPEDTGNCESYEVTFTPNTLPTGADACPGTFRDSVTATGDPPTGGGTITPATASANCNLCLSCSESIIQFLSPATVKKPHKK